LPGGAPAKTVQSLVLLVAAVLLLFLWIFPYAARRLPIDNGGLTHYRTSPTTATQ
jgi:hypothetical protein